MALRITTTNKEVEVHHVAGREFLTRAEAERHLTVLRKQLGFAFYRVDSGYDFTEGRGYFTHQVIAVRQDQHGQVASNVVFAHCLDTLGAPVSDSYGYPVNTWVVREPKSFDDSEQLHEWLNQQQRINAEYGHRYRGVTYLDGFGKPIDED